MKYERLSSSRIKRTLPGTADIWLSDSDGSRGNGKLLLRIAPTGVRRFYYRYSVAGQRKMIPLGLYARNSCAGYLTLSQAREKGLAFRIALSLSTTPSPTTTPRPPTFTNTIDQSAGVMSMSPAQRPGLTLLELCLAYCDSLKRRKRVSEHQVRLALVRHVAPSKFAHRLARDVTEDDVAELLRGILATGIGRTAAQVRSHLRAAYASAIEARRDPTASQERIDRSITINPVVGIKALSQFNCARERVLSRSELREFWKRLQEQEGGADSIALRTLRLDMWLGGQRCKQLLRVTVADVDMEAETILLHDGKGKNRDNPRQHLLPLTRSGKKEAQWLIAHSRDVDSTYLFASNVTHRAICEASVSRLVWEISREMLAAGKVQSKFQFSDLRRTAETTLASLGVHEQELGQLLSHGLTGLQQKHYNKHTYMPEKKRILILWEEFLASLLVDESTISDTAHVARESAELTLNE